jgi:hypothetical protein
MAKYAYQFYNYDMPYSQLKVVGEEEARGIVADEPGHWNVVSIYAEKWDALKQEFVVDPPDLPGAKSMCRQHFHDITRPTSAGVLCNEEHIKEILKYSETVVGEPLLIHCHAGISRSTAIAFLILLNQIKDKSEWPIEDALSIVYKVRPYMYPNKHVIAIGIPLIVRSEQEEILWFRELYNSDTMAKVVGGLR